MIVTKTEFVLFLFGGIKMSMPFYHQDNFSDNVRNTYWCGIDWGSDSGHDGGHGSDGDGNWDGK